ncbi:MAG: hypothetical protein ACOCXA_06915, partial [Planctomycetota bacterium]
AALGVKVATTIKSASRSGSDIQMPSADGSSQAVDGSGGGAATGTAGADDPTAQIAAERDEQAQPGRLIIPDGVALDARQLAAYVNEAGRQGFIFDGIQLTGAPA